jgi:hypothetical protein
MNAHEHGAAQTEASLAKRLHELRQELAKGETQLANLDHQRNLTRDTLLRISGAIQVLQELLASPEQAIAFYPEEPKVEPDFASSIPMSPR